MNIERIELQRLVNDQSDYALVLHLDSQDTEFSSELGRQPEQRRDILSTARLILKTQYPKAKVSIVKVMVGGMLITTIPLSTNLGTVEATSPTGSTQTQQASSIYYQVSSGDSLWTISRQFNTSMDNIRRGNNLTSDTLQLNQFLIIPRAFHTVRSGDSLSMIARDYSSTTSAIREANRLSSDIIRVGQSLVIPVIINDTRSSTISSNDSISQSTPTTITYTVVSGDSLSVIAQRFATTTSALRSANNLSTDVIRVGQTLIIPSQATSEPTTPKVQTIDSIYTVRSGDNLSTIAQRFGTTISAIRDANNLKTDVLQIGQRLVIPSGNTSLVNPTEPTIHPSPALNPTPALYTVVSGDSLWGIATRYGVTVDALRTANNLRTDTLQVGQTLTIPRNGNTTPVQPTTSIYTVVSGDNLSVIANRFGVTVDAIRIANNLRTDVLQIGQTLTIPTGSSAKVETPIVQTGSLDPVTITNIQHTIRSGDNLWNISQQYGVPYLELLRHNNLTERSVLQVGQIIQVPQYNVPIRPVVSAKHGEVLDWWTEARYVFSTGKVATITDFQTGRQFQVRHTMGGNHADSEPLTARDAEIMREIWGGNYSWNPRAIIVEVDGRRLAAAMHSMPHGDQVIRDNNYNGHFCIHFLNSQRHGDGQVQDSMQRQIEVAAGRGIR